MNIIFLGPPGAGKGTQADLLAEKIGLVHISTGDIFREHISRGTILGKKAKEYIDDGNLVPDDITQQILVARLLIKDCESGFIIDGFPRTIGQAEFIMDFISNRNQRIDYVLDLDIPDEFLIERITGRRICKKCGASYHLTLAPPKTPNLCNSCFIPLIIRVDDTKEALKTRLLAYHKEAEPIIDYFKNNGIYYRIVAKNCIDEAAQEIYNTVSNKNK